ncbi:MAG: SH3 domain-containing protein [Treponemataceae bacterium]
MRILKIAFIFAFCFFVSACSKVIGYGVVNWSIPEYNLVAGDVLPVYIKSNVSKAYIVELDNGEKKEIPLWQLRFFKSKSEVDNFKQKIAENAFFYAEVLRDGLPMRLHPENTSDQVYRLRSRQIIKILWEGEGIPVLVNDKPLDGKWYRVMTDDGAEGWCFSLNLRIFDERETETTASQETEIQSDPILLEMLDKQWYPESYSKMLSINRVDLENISPDYGFFPGLKTNVARINIKGTDLSFTYSTIKKSDANVYNFEGSNLSMQIRAANRIAVQFTDPKGMPDVEYFTTLEKPLEEIIKAEQERRAEVISDISNAGPKFNSVSYGNLHITNDGDFVWDGFDVISGKIIPAGAKTTGHIEIRFFASPKFSHYNSVLSFYFDGLADSVDFLANLTEQGLHMEYVEKKNIVESIVESRNKQPVVMFFGR